MRYFTLGSIMAMVALSFSLAQPANAYIFGFSADKPQFNGLMLSYSVGVEPTLALLVDDRGWYTGASHDSAIGNYNVALPGEFGPEAFRNFFVFDTSLLVSKETIISASLQIYSFDVTGSQTYELYHVKTPIHQLVNGPFLSETFDDLGGGTIYGSRPYTEADSWDYPGNTNAYRTINLSSDFVAALNAVVQDENDLNKGRIAMGGRIVPYTSSPVPEPSSLLLLGAGLLGLAVWRWKQTA